MKTILSLTLRSLLRRLRKPSMLRRVRRLEAWSLLLRLRLKASQRSHLLQLQPRRLPLSLQQRPSLLPSYPLEIRSLYLVYAILILTCLYRCHLSAPCYDLMTFTNLTFTTLIVMTTLLLYFNFIVYLCQWLYIIHFI